MSWFDIVKGGVGLALGHKPLATEAMYDSYKKGGKIKFHRMMANFYIIKRKDAGAAREHWVAVDAMRNSDKRGVVSIIGASYPEGVIDQYGRMIKKYGRQLHGPDYTYENMLLMPMDKEAI